MKLLRKEIVPESVDTEFERLRKEAVENSAEKDLMRMHWQCQSCFVQGREDHSKPMAEFGVRCPADFVKRLLVQGAWSRCQLCTRAERFKTLNDANEARRASAADAVRACRLCGEEKLRGDFWPVDWQQGAHRAISCKACSPMPPSERRAAALASQAVHTCATCHGEKPRAEYWP
eukprot:9640608-Karenia_brevis.AAC.1